MNCARYKCVTGTKLAAYFRDAFLLRFCNMLLQNPRRNNNINTSPVKNAVFWDVTTPGSCNNWRFGGTYRLHHRGDKKRRTRSNISSNQHPKLVTGKVFRSSPILFTLIREAIRSSETSVITRARRLHIPEDDILHSHGRKKLIYST
jgi:hypothetical protein